MSESSYLEFLAALANPNRIRIINALGKRELNVSESSSVTYPGRSAVSHNLLKLKLCSFVSVLRMEKCRHTPSDRKTMIPVMNILDGQACLNFEGILLVCGGK